MTSTADELINNPAYEAGYQDGQSSGNFDWIIALDLLPFDVNCPDDVIRGFAAMQPAEMTDEQLRPYFNEVMRRRMAVSRKRQKEKK
jgi:hypothetical protein